MNTPGPTGVSRLSLYPRIALALGTLVVLVVLAAVAAFAIPGFARQKDNTASLIATVAPTPATTVESLLLPDPMATAVLPTVPPADTSTPTPKPLWDLESLTSNANVVAEARIIGSETRPNSFTFIFYVRDWYKNEHKVKDNIVRLTLDTTKNWDNLVSPPRNLIGSTDGPGSHKFILFLQGTPDNYSIVGETVGIFFLREGRSVQAGVGAEQYQEMPIQDFKEEIRALLNITPTPPPPTSTPLPTPDDGRPVSLLKQGDDYRVYPHRGNVSFVGVGRDSWIGPSLLLIHWSSGKEPYEYKTYAADLQSGTLEEYNLTPEWHGLGGGYGTIIHPDGKRVLLLEGATEDVWGMSLYDMVTKKEHTVFDRSPTVPQWAGKEVHEEQKSLSPGTPTWLDDSKFLLPIGYFPSEVGPRPDSPPGFILLLVDTNSKQVRVLSREAGNYKGQFGGPITYQGSEISSALHMLPPPYTGKPITLTPGGPWIRDWVASPDGSRVAWVEATAPPGDWSERLPGPCIPCERYGPIDPEPQVQAIAIWDAATQQVYRHKPESLVWTLGSAFLMQHESLHWRTDGSALLYATHSSAPARSALYSLSPSAQPDLLAEHPWDGTVNFLADGQDGSIYYYVTGQKYYKTGDIVRRHPDGKLELLYEYLSPNMWALEPGKWLQVLGDGVVYVHDFDTGKIRQARFRQDAPSPGELDWAGLVGMVPLSPDGQWSAYAGKSDELMASPPPIMPDRGPEMQIVRVK